MKKLICSLGILTLMCSAVFADSTSSSFQGIWAEASYHGNLPSSPDSLNYLVLQGSDGNLVLYNRNPIWSTGTHGHKGAKAPVMQPDGNYVIYDADGKKALWSTNTNGRVDARKPTMQPDGNFVMYGGKSLWASGTAGHPGARLEMLETGQLAVVDTDSKILWSSPSTGKRYAVKDLFYEMRSDGDFVLSDKNNNILWHTNTSGHSHATYSMQADGNFVIYSQSPEPIWSTGTAGHPDAKEPVMQSDGNYVMYDKPKVIWSPNIRGGAWGAVKTNGDFVIYDKHGNEIWSSHTSVLCKNIVAANTYNKFYLVITDDEKLELKGVRIDDKNPEILWSNGKILIPCAGSAVL